MKDDRFPEIDSHEVAEAIADTVRYIEWRFKVLESINQMIARFSTPWFPGDPVVLYCAPKHLKYPLKRRKKRIIKKWHTRYYRKLNKRIGLINVSPKHCRSKRNRQFSY